MHIALVTPAWPPNLHSNGIVTYVHWMRHGLSRLGCRVSVFSVLVDPSIQDPDIHRISNGTLSAQLAKLLAILSRNNKSVFDYGSAIAAAIAKAHRRTPIDIIEMEESFGWAARVREETGLPLVVKLHGPAFLHLVEEEQATPFGKEKILREGKALARLPVITSPSKGHLTATLTRYGLRPALAEHVDNPLGLPSQTPLWELAHCNLDTVLFVGRFDKVKGGDVVIKAFQILHHRRPSLRLLFVGPDEGLISEDGSRMTRDAYINSMQDNAVADAMTFRGRLAPEEIGILRSRALCTVVASRRENQSYTAVEAMLQSCPVVFTDASGLTELVEPGVNGLMAKAGDFEDLADKIWQIVEDPALGERLGKQARKFALHRHDPVAVASKSLDVYRRTIALAR